MALAMTMRSPNSCVNNNKQLSSNSNRQSSCVNNSNKRPCESNKRLRPNKRPWSSNSKRLPCSSDNYKYESSGRLYKFNGMFYTTYRDWMALEYKNEMEK